MFRHTVPVLVALALLAASCSSAADVTTTSAPVTTAETTEKPAQLMTTTTGATTPTTGASTTTTEAATSTTESGVTEIVITVEAGSVAVERFDVPLDATVRLIVTADVADEIHLHGYDLHADVSPVADGVVEFDATIPGIFEVELEESHLLIAELQVTP